MLHLPRSPLWRNGYIESFNGLLRNECLNVEWFTSLEHAAAKLAQWCNHYNHQRPHSALDGRAPFPFARLQGGGPMRFALSASGKANSEPRQGFATPADATVDPIHPLAEGIHYEGGALLRIA